jgi:hypothetical protein
MTMNPSLEGQSPTVEMTSILTQIATLAAGLAICTTAFVNMPRSSLKGVAVAVSLCIVAAVRMTAIRNFG